MRGVIDADTVERLLASDDVEVQAGDVRAQRSDRSERVLDLLVRHQPRQHDDRRVCGARSGRSRGQLELVDAVAHHRDPAAIDAERGILGAGRIDRLNTVLTKVMAQR